MNHSSPQTAPLPVRLIVLLLIVASAGYIARVAVTVAAPGIMHDFNLTQAQMGTVFSAFLLGYTVCQIPSGILADHISVRPIFLSLAAGWTVLSLLTAFVGWHGFALGLALPVLWMIRGLFGVVAAPTYPTSARTMAVVTSPHQRARANALVMASIGIGSAFTPLVLSPIQTHFGWRPVLLLAATLAAASGLLWWLLAPRQLPAMPLTHAATSDSPGLPHPLRTANFWFLSASYFLQGYLGYIFIFWFYLYLLQVRHMQVLQAAGFSALPWLATMFAIPLGGFLSDAAVSRWGPITGRRVVPLFALAVSGIFLFVGARTPSAFVAVAALTISTVLVLGTEGPFWATMTQLSGQRSGLAGGTMNFLSNLGGMISPSLTPWLAERIGWASALSLTSGLAIVAALLWLPISDSRLKPAPELASPPVVPLKSTSGDP